MAIQSDGVGGRVVSSRPKSTSLFHKPQPTVNTAPSRNYAGTASSAQYARPAGASAPAPVASGGGGGGSYGGGGGGGYGGTPAAAPMPPRRSLADVIAGDFMLRQQQEENARLEREYGAETDRLRGETEREQVTRRADLATDLSDMSLDSAEDLAGRGLLNSGGLFLNQDRINAEGARRESSIADLMTQLLSQRGQGLQGLQGQGRNRLNERISDITTQYGQGIGGY